MYCIHSRVLKLLQDFYIRLLQYSLSIEQPSYGRGTDLLFILIAARAVLIYAFLGKHVCMDTRCNSSHIYIRRENTVGPDLSDHVFSSSLKNVK